MNREGKQLQGRYWVDDGAAQLAQVVPARTLRYAGVEPRRLPWRQVWNVPAPGASMRSRYSTVVRHLEVNPRTAFGDRDGMPHWFDIRPIKSPTMSKTKWTCEPDESKLRAFHKADRQPPADEGWPMVRGILAGAVVEAELLRWAKREGLSVDLGAAIDTQLVRQETGRRSHSRASV